MFVQLSEPGGSPTQQSRPKAIGIDLGTTHSVVAYADETGVRVLTHDHGDELVPSVVFYGEENAPPVVGYRALSIGQTAPPNCVISVKRLMGTRGDHVASSAQGSVTMPRVKLGAITKTPIDVSADILKELKRIAEHHLKEPVTKAVITVPAYFDEGARVATKEAARLAGLDVLRLINEPTAAALAYGLDTQAEGLYAIYDLGGGTFDLSLLRLTKGVFQVLATGGDTYLGGDDIDARLAQHMFGNTDQIACLKAKKIKEYLTDHAYWSEDGSAFSRADLEKLASPLIDQTLAICQDVLSRINHEDIQGVVLVGGATRMPLVRQKVVAFFKRQPLVDHNPDTVVALGAALQARTLVSGEGTLLLDITPLSLGLETMGGLVEKIIPKNTPIPASYAQDFTTYEDGQTAMSIHVVQGEREFVQDCRSLGAFTLTGIPPMTAGAARIRVHFMVDADGLLSVSAQEMTSGVRQSVEIAPSYGVTEEMTDADVYQMLKDSLENGQADWDARLLVEQRLKGEQLINQLIHALQEDQALLEASEQENLLQKIENLRTILTTQDRHALQSAVQDLATSSQFFAERRLSHSIQKALKGHKVGEK